MHRIFRCWVCALWADLILAFSPTPPPSLAGCFHEVQDYVDSPATDRLPNGGVVSNPAVCQRKCQHESWCDHFVWKPAANFAKGFFAKSCWLLNGDGTVVVSSAATTMDFVIHGPKVCPQSGYISMTAHKTSAAGMRANRTSVAKTDSIRDSHVEPHQGATMIGSKRLIGRVVSFVHHKLEWWMIILMSIATFLALMLLCCQQCSCNKKSETLSNHDDLVVDPGDATVESKSMFDKRVAKPVEMLSQASAKSDHNLDHKNCQNPFNGAQEQLVLGCPWMPLADKVPWWNVLARAPTTPTGYSAILQVPPQEPLTPPLVPSMWHQDIALGLPVESSSLSDGFCLSERSGTGPVMAGPVISRPRTPAFSCSSRAGSVSGPSTPSFPSKLARNRSFPGHLSPPKPARSPPSLFHDDAGASSNSHDRREGHRTPGASSNYHDRREGHRTPVRGRVVPLSPERIQQAVRLPCEGSSPGRIKQAVKPPPEEASAEWVQLAGMPPREGSETPSMMSSQVAGSPSTGSSPRRRRLSPERVQTLQSMLKFVDLPFVRHDV